VWNNQATSVFPTAGTFFPTTIITTSAVATAAPQFNAAAPVVVGVSGSASAAGDTTYQVDPTNPVTATITLYATNLITVSFSAAGSTFTTFAPTTSTTTIQTGLQASQFFGTSSFSISGPTAIGAGATASATFEVGPINLTLVIPNQSFSYTFEATTSFTALNTTVTREGPSSVDGFEISQGATGTCRAEFDKEPATGTGAAPITTARGPRLDIRFTIPR
jgi:hypothetical protein